MLSNEQRWLGTDYRPEPWGDHLRWPYVGHPGHDDPPIYWEMVQEYGIPFHIWAFFSHTLADFMHPEFVKRWYYFHGLKMTYGLDLSAGPGGAVGVMLAYGEHKGDIIYCAPNPFIQQTIRPGTWTIPEYHYPNPFEDTSPLKPISELAPLLDDADLTVTYYRDPYPTPESPAQEILNLIHRIMAELPIELFIDDTKAIEP